MIALLSVVIASLFLPVFVVAPTAKAAVTSCNLDSSGWKSIPTGPISDRKKLNWNDQFNIQFAVAFDIKDTYSLELAKYCKDNKQKHNFYIYAYATIQTLSARGDVVTRTVKSDKPLEVPAQFYTLTDSADKTKITEYGYAARVPATVKSFFPNAPTSNSTVCDKQPCLITTSVYVYYGQSWTSYKFPGVLGINYSDQPIEGDQPTELPPLPAGVTAGGPVGGGAKTGVDYTKIGMTVTANSAGKGLRSKYRVLVSDNSMAFNGKDGPDPVFMKWTSEDPALQLTVNDTFTLPKKDNSWFNYDLEPSYVGSNLGFNYADTPVKNLESCAPAYFSTDCSKAFFESDKGMTNGTAKPLPDQFNPVLNSSAWLRNRNDKAEAGKPIATNQFKVVAFIKGLSLKAGIGQNSNVYVLYNSEAKFTVEVYRTLDEIKSACKADVPDDQKSKCDSDPNFAKYGFADTVTAEAQSSELQDGGIASNLFGFLRKVIAYIILLMTSIMYYIFAYILVPVLNALLKIQPYRDEFVNVIYPGWVIIRNISNIAFIIALLVMGLRILFQQEDASKSRGFIVTLVLMALLVNFSLVIGQGIVGIADTVQAQFLPAESRVVEALGQKLMVDPIKTFRSGEYSVTDSGNKFTVDGSASDLFKPIALWVLAGAAFWSFVALIAFMFIRLVALWVLYMLSPLAYVGRILPETRTYANQWWSHFLKYAFTVPILAFFLNITALVAVTFSGRMGDVVKSTGTFAGELTEFALTVISHFIVLLFLFIGMKFALSFGGAGAKQVVDFAKKGFDYMGKKPAQWAGRAAQDLAKNTAKSQYERRIAGGLLDPKAWKQGWKDRISKTDEKMRNERLLRKEGRLNPEIATQNIGKSLKYLWHKATMGAPHRLYNEAGQNLEKAGIMTAAERQDQEGIKARNEAAKGFQDRFAEYIKGDANGHIDPVTAPQMLADIDAEIARLSTEGINESVALEAEANALEAQGNASGAKAKRDEAQSRFDEYEKRADALQEIRNKFAQFPNGTVDLNLDDGLRKDIADSLAKEVSEFEKNIKNAENRISENNSVKSRYGFVGDMDEATRKELQEKAERLQSDANDRRLPESLSIKALRREGEDKEAKKYEGVDDPEELMAIYKKAMRDNNLLLASAMAKKLAKEGFFKDLLQGEGYRNNFKSMQSFFEKQFKNVSPNIRMQIMSEVSYLNGQNGNLAASKATKVDPNSGALRYATEAEHMKKINGFIESRNPNDLKNLKGDQATYEGDDGKTVTYDGYIKAMKKHLQSLDPTEFKKYVAGIGPAMAKKVVSSVNFDSFGNDVAGRRIKTAFENRAS